MVHVDHDRCSLERVLDDVVSSGLGRLVVPVLGVEVPQAQLLAVVLQRLLDGLVDRSVRRTHDVAVDIRPGDLPGKLLVRQLRELEVVERVVDDEHALFVGVADVDAAGLDVRAVRRNADARVVLLRHVDELFVQLFRHREVVEHEQDAIAAIAAVVRVGLDRLVQLGLRPGRSGGCLLGQRCGDGRCRHGCFCLRLNGGGAASYEAGHDQCDNTDARESSNTNELHWNPHFHQ